MNKTRTFTEHVAHLQSMADLKVGERVVVTGTGRTGTVVGGARRHAGVLVHWDEPMFGVEEGRVTLALLDRLYEGTDA